MPRRRNSAKSRQLKAEFLRQKREILRESKQHQTVTTSVSTTPHRKVIIVDQSSPNQIPEKIQEPTPVEEDFLQITIDLSDHLEL